MAHKSKKASESVLEQLHAITAQKLIERLQSEDGPTVGEISAAIRFLKDNGIEADPDTHDKMQEIMDSLPSFDDDNEGLPVNR